jgi:hypothetical protein
MNRLIGILLGAAVALLAGCSGERDPGDILVPRGAGTIVVDGRLIVGEQIPLIRLRLTQSADRNGPSGSTALIGADVMVTTSDGDTARYFNRSGTSEYIWEGAIYESFVVRPHTTYFLHVEAPDGRIVTAQTTTPDSFHVREWVLLDGTTLEPIRRLEAPSESTSKEYVYYASSNQLIYQNGILEARFDRSNALAFQMALFNLESDSPFLIDADFLSEEDRARLGRESSSPPLDAPDGFVRLPWLAVWYEGRHRFVVYSVDRNWYDVVRSVRFDGPNNLGFGSNAGDDLERPIFHINGGIGLFGSAAMDWTGFTVWPKR